MRTYRVTQVRQEGALVMVTSVADDDQETLREVHFPATVLEGRMAEYGYTDPAEALDAMLHEPLLWEHLAELEARDEPAVVAGWVTTTTPDAEPVMLHNARSGADAAGANRARIAAVKAQYARLDDPDGLLRPLAGRPLDGALIEHHRRRVDISRWELVYGELPVRTATADGRAPIQMRG